MKSGFIFAFPVRVQITMTSFFFEVNLCMTLTKEAKWADFATRRERQMTTEGQEEWSGCSSHFHVSARAVVK